MVASNWVHMPHRWTGLAQTISRIGQRQSCNAGTIRNAGSHSFYSFWFFDLTEALEMGKVARHSIISTREPFPTRFTPSGVRRRSRAAPIEGTFRRSHTPRLWFISAECKTQLNRAGIEQPVASHCMSHPAGMRLSSSHPDRNKKRSRSHREHCILFGIRFEQKNRVIFAGFLRQHLLTRRFRSHSSPTSAVPACSLADEPRILRHGTRVPIL